MLSLLALVLAADPAVKTQLDAPPPPRAVAYTYPLGTLALGAMSAAARNSLGVGYLPLGVEVPLSERVSLDVELGFTMLTTFGRTSGWAVEVSTGPTWYSSQDKALTGFFIGPRFQVLIGDAGLPPVLAAGSGDAPLVLGPAIRRSFLVGFDAGYQWRVGPVVFGPVIGASVGYTFDSASIVATPFAFEFTRAGRPDTFSFAVNLNLFRLGISL